MYYVTWLLYSNAGRRPQVPGPHLAGEDDIRRRFLHEAQAVAALSHPNICVVHEVDEELNFIAMEYVEGETVAAKVKRRPLPMDDVLNVAMSRAPT